MKFTKKVTVFVVAACTAFSFFHSHPVNAAGPNYLYGWLKRNDGTPMAQIAVWYCTAPSQDFSACSPKQLPKTDFSGKWALNTLK